MSFGRLFIKSHSELVNGLACACNIAGITLRNTRATLHLSFGSTQAFGQILHIPKKSAPLPVTREKLSAGAAPGKLREFLIRYTMVSNASLQFHYWSCNASISMPGMSDTCRADLLRKNRRATLKPDYVLLKFTR